MQLFYNKEISSNTKQILFNKDESRHIIRVLRKKENDILYITNGQDYLFTAIIDTADAKKCVATITKIEKKEKPWSYYLHIAIAPTKNNERLEWFLEKATEIGIDEITPIICQNSERKVVKMERLGKIIQGAMKQSLKFRLPKLNKPVTFSVFINKKQTDPIFIAHCNPLKKELLKDVINPNSKITILIGPEGDFSIDEIQQSMDKNFIPISLGKSRLRTETAGLTAVQNIAFMHQ